MGILEGISAAKTGIELTKIVRELLGRERLNRSEIEGRIEEIQGYLTDAREALEDALAENRKLKAEIEQLKAQREIKAAVIAAEGAYWRRKQDEARWSILHRVLGSGLSAGQLVVCQREEACGARNEAHISVPRA